ncbi:hypothetical protein CKO41_02925 [Thiococcus pfennigii]|nr:hypothetical protein [Thiococcus pfennigii]
MVRRNETPVSDFVRAIGLVLLLLAPLFVVLWWLSSTPSPIERWLRGETAPPASALGEAPPSLPTDSPTVPVAPGDRQPTVAPDLVRPPSGRQDPRSGAEIRWSEPEALRDAACHEATVSVLYDDSHENRARRDRICKTVRSGASQSRD